MSIFEVSPNGEASKRPIQENTYDSEERTFRFALGVRRIVKLLPRAIGKFEDVKQVVRSSGSVGANDIEAHDAISRKESKESVDSLRWLDTGDRDDVELRRQALVHESTELMTTFGAILRNWDEAGAKRFPLRW